MFKKSIFVQVTGAITVTLAGVLAAPAWAATPNASAKPVACPPILQHSFLRLQDEKPQALCQYAGQVALVVNTASYCGYTGQYKGLEALAQRYKNKGLVVLGFPSNDFSQEPDANGKIADFCESTFGVKFPMFTKTTVAGPAAAPFYKQLAAQTGQTPQWNFHKYLIGRDGKVVASYKSNVAPESPNLIKDIEAQLVAK
jgi:glutathione peroxidase